MFKKLSFAAVLAASTVLGMSVDAEAAFIKGDFAANGFLKGSALGTGPIVSILSTIPTLGTVVVGEAHDDYAGLAGEVGAILAAFDVPIPPNPTLPGWLTFGGGVVSFDLTSASAVTGGAAFSCDAASGQCTDSATFTFEGEISVAGFDTSKFTGSFAMVANCEFLPGGPPVCNDTPVGSFSLSIGSSGEPPGEVPVPATLALLGAALVGLGVTRRRA